jgi:hypothetical protein
MSVEGHSPAPPAGHDILVRYLTVYARARELAELERPWGLGDGALDGLWTRLLEALSRDPEGLDSLVTEELSDADREQIAATLSPLLFAIPLRECPTEVRVIRAGVRLGVSLRRYVRVAHAAGGGPRVAEGGDLSDGGAGRRAWRDDPIGFLPAVLTSSFAAYLRRALRVPEGQRQHEAVVSSGGRRRRVRVTLLAQDKGVVIRFLERLPSPLDE